MTNTEYSTLGSVAALIAQTLRISLRSLQRTLNKEETNFKTLLDRENTG